MQLGSLGVRHDEVATLELLRGLHAWPREQCSIATGYFNLTPAYSRAIVAARGTRVRVLTAAPAANGFFGARGMSGAVPAAYDELARRFFEACERAGRGEGGGGRSGGAGVSLHEYARAGWTFHAKGLWLSSSAAEEGARGGAVDATGVTAAAAAAAAAAAPVPSPRSMLSLVGSPNFGLRSTERDLELQFSFATADGGLVARLEQEQRTLWGAPDARRMERATWAQPGRRIEGLRGNRGLWIHAFLAVFRGLF